MTLSHFLRSENQQLSMCNKFFDWNSFQLYLVIRMLIRQKYSKCLFQKFFSRSNWVFSNNTPRKIVIQVSIYSFVCKVLHHTIAMCPAVFVSKTFWWWFWDHKVLKSFKFPFWMLFSTCWAWSDQCTVMNTEKTDPGDLFSFRRTGISTTNKSEPLQVKNIIHKFFLFALFNYG